MRKFILFPLAAVVMLFTACQHTENEEVPANGTGSINFNVINYEQSSLDDVTRATDISSLSHLAMGIYDATTNAMVSIVQQSNGDSDYGTFSAQLPYGSYTIVFLGYTGSRQANMESPTDIYFADNYVPDLLYKTISITISSSESASLSIALKRAVAAFTVRSEGDIPSNAAKMRISSTGGGHVFNALTGYAKQTADRSYTFNLTSVAGTATMQVNYYTFLTSDEATMDFSVVARDASDADIRTREFTSVPMKINQRTRYTGDFFASDQSTQGFTISLEDGDMTEDNHTY